MECVLEAGDALGESIVWCSRTNRLWWTDVLTATVHELTWPAAEHRLHPLPFRRLGSIGLHRDGGLVVATELGVFRWSPSEGVGAQVMPARWNPLTYRLNDGRCDRAGRFWVASMCDSYFGPSGTLYSLGPDKQVRSHIDDLVIPNAIAFSPDDRRFYFADTRQYVIWEFEFDLSEGRLGRRRTFATFGTGPARPDGSCVDADGCVWNATYAGAAVTHYTPDGKTDTVVPLPVTYPTCVCIGGPDLDTLFVTSSRYPLTAAERVKEPLAGGLFAHKIHIAGLVEPECQL